MTKACPRCKEIKQLTEFYKDKARKDGRSPYCKSCRKKATRRYYHANKEARLSYSHQYYKENKEVKREYDKKYHQARKPVRNKYEREKRKTDLLYKLRHNIRCLIRGAFKKRGYSKKSKTFEILGCEEWFLREHLEVTWRNNYGTEYNGEVVHIDHIIPISSAKTEEELIKLNHWTNLQYLTPEDNIKKSDIVQSENIN